MKKKKIHAHGDGGRSLCKVIRFTSQEGKFSDSWEGVTCGACLRFRLESFTLPAKSKPSPAVEARAAAFYADMGRKAGEARG